MKDTTKTHPLVKVLILGVPNLASFHNRLLLAIGRQPTCIQNNSAHIRGFTRPDILKLLNIFPGGYELKSFGGGNFYPFAPILAKPLANIFPSMAWSNFFLLKKPNLIRKISFLSFLLMKSWRQSFILVIRCC